MAPSMSGDAAGARPATPHDDLLLRETLHRASNDLQLVVSLLSLQSKRAATPETREALADVMNRVAVLARARAELTRQRQPSLEAALRQVCEALGAQAEPRSILISMRTENDVRGLSAQQIATVALAVNELATNAIKHAFEEEKAGHISVVIRRNGDRETVVLVDDDGLPFPELEASKGDGMGLGLVKRLVASVDGLLIPPSPGQKLFEIRVPLSAS